MVHHAPLPQMLHVAVYPTHRHLSGIDFLYAAVLSLYEKLALIVDPTGGTAEFSLGIQLADFSVPVHQEFRIGVSEPFQVMGL